MKKAAFLDRDGVINEIVSHPELKDKDGKICKDPLSLAEFKYIAGVKEACKMLKDAGYTLIVVSNQPGVAKGFYKDVGTIKEIDEKMKKDLEIDAAYNCLHHPRYTGECECRKPKEGLLRQAAKDHDIDLSQSILVGDSISDINAGSLVMKRFLVGKNNEDTNEDAKIVRSLKEAADYMIRIEKEYGLTKNSSSVINKTII